MLHIGITGGIGTGKSTVCKIFAVVGVPIYDADTQAKWLITHDSALKAEICTAFGEESYFPTGELNRQYLAKKVFSEASQTQKMNAIVHPAVAKDYERWASYYKNTHLYVLKEAALMIESNSYQQLDKLIVVTADLEMRLDRIKKRDTFRSDVEIRSIIQKQMPEEEKLKYADFVILNDGKNLLIPQVLDLHTTFCQMSRSMSN